MKALLILAIVVWLVYSKSIVLTDKDFTSGNVVDSAGHGTNAWFIKFYLPTCYHCQQFAPTWDKFVAEFEKTENIKFGELDCSKYRSTCLRFDVRGVPTLLMFKDNFFSEYTYPFDFNRLSEYINFQQYDEDLLTERAPIPSAATNQHVKPK